MSESAREKNQQVAPGDRDGPSRVEQARNVMLEVIRDHLITAPTLRYTSVPLVVSRHLDILIEAVRDDRRSVEETTEDQSRVKRIRGSEPGADRDVDRGV